MNLKNLYLLFSLTLTSLSLFSQQCTNDSLLSYPPGDINYIQPGFINPNDLPCLQSTVYSEVAIPFKTYNQGARLLTLLDSTTVPVSHIYSIKVENITNLPSGLCWITRPASKTISGDDVGIIIIKGTTTATVGTYPLAVSLSLDVTGSGSFTYTGLGSDNYKSLLGQVILKVMDASNNCPAIN